MTSFSHPGAGGIPSAQMTSPSTAANSTLLHLQMVWCGFYALSKQDFKLALGLFRGLFLAEIRTELSLAGYAMVLYQEYGNTDELDRHLPTWGNFSALTLVIAAQLAAVKSAASALGSGLNR